MDQAHFSSHLVASSFPCFNRIMFLPSCTGLPFTLYCRLEVPQFLLDFFFPLPLTEGLLVDPLSSPCANTCLSFPPDPFPLSLVKLFYLPPPPPKQGLPIGIVSKIPLLKPLSPCHLGMITPPPSLWTRYLILWSP